MHVARVNAQMIIQYTTAYPFRLPESTIVCVYCCDSYPDPDKFRKHMQEEHEDFKVRLAFAHLHEGYIKVDCTDLRCRICDQSFDRVQTAAEHLKTFHDKNIDLDNEIAMHPFKIKTDMLLCALCDYKAPNLRTLSRHIHKHYLQYTCESCGKSYATATSLQHHIRYTCKSSGMQRQCRKCKQAFNSPDDQRQHLMVSKKCCQHVCTLCGERFGYWRLKREHMTKVHGLPNVQYPCPECGTVFAKPDALRNHFQIVHTDDHLVCSICGQKYDTEHKLNRHMIVHTGEKAFACSVCSKAFARKFTLAQHMWIHSEVKKYECKVCDKPFNQRVSWKKHMKTYHPELCDF